MQAGDRQTDGPVLNATMPGGAKRKIEAGWVHAASVQTAQTGLFPKATSLDIQTSALGSQG